MARDGEAPGRAVFLDRDGVIIEDAHRLVRHDEMRLLPGAARAIARLNRAGFKVVVVTNQAVVARGLATRSAVETVHRELRARLRRSGARLDAVYYCPHHPRFGERRRCACRKPAAGMLKAAARRFGLKLEDCFMIGDSTTDIRAARNAGCAAILVRTGKAGKDGRCKARPDAVCRDLGAAARWVLGRA